MADIDLTDSDVPFESIRWTSDDIGKTVTYVNSDGCLIMDSKIVQMECPGSGGDIVVPDENGAPILAVPRIHSCGATCIGPIEGAGRFHAQHGQVHANEQMQLFEEWKLRMMEDEDSDEDNDFIA